MVSSPDNDGTEQHCQMLRARLARRKVHVRNQRQTPLKRAANSNLVDQGWFAARTHAPAWGTLVPVDVAGAEATVNACGVVVARLQGHSWAPTPSNGSTVNVGTIPAVPSPIGSQPFEGKTCRRLMPPGWGGGPVVVRGRESRPHGEGAQCVRSINADPGVRW